MLILASRKVHRSQSVAVGSTLSTAGTTRLPCSPAYPRRREAVEITNATGYGLSAGVWSRDIDTALGYARATKAGTVWINCYMDGFPEISFGGYGASGIGRELGRTAIDEYIEHKSTIIRTGAQAPSWVGGVGEK